jgi:hypothetical protein
MIAMALPSRSLAGRLERAAGELQRVFSRSNLAGGLRLLDRFQQSADYRARLQLKLAHEVVAGDKPGGAHYCIVFI